jgi:prophage regulatory protein
MTRTPALPERAYTLPATGFVRLSQIIGNPRRGIPGPFPVCATTWWAWVASGRAPKPLKLGPAMTVWRAEDIYRLIETLVVDAESTPPAHGEAPTATRADRRTHNSAR